MKYVTTLIALIGTLLFGELVMAQQGLAAGFGLIVYPGNGQASDQQAKDEGECFQWGKQTTGVDPANPLANVQTQSAPAQPAPGGAAAGGALRGAAKGALIGNLADEDAGDYAAAGALIGGARSSKRAAQQQSQAQSQAAAKNQAQKDERMGLFKNAFAACMEGRKYTVK